MSQQSIQIEIRPILSVVVNNFNYGRFLYQSIASCLQQADESVEVIVIDDGSSDDSLRVLSTFDGRIKSLQKTNGGQGSAYNAGFHLCEGNYVLFLDADDFLLPNAISSIIKVIQTRCNDKERVSKIHYPLMIVDYFGVPNGSTEPPRPLPEGDLYHDVAVKGGYLSPPASGNVYSRAFLNDVLPMQAEIWRGGADCYLFNLAPLFGKVVSINLPLACYRVHGINMSVVVVDGKIRSAALINDINIDDRVQRTISEKLGRRLTSDQMLKESGFLKIRSKLIYRKLFPEECHIDMSLSTLASYMLRSLIASDAKKSTKVRYTLWVFALLILPRAAASRIVRPIYRLRTFHGKSNGVNHNILNLL